MKGWGRRFRRKRGWRSLEEEEEMEGRRMRLGLVEKIQEEEIK